MIMLLSQDLALSDFMEIPYRMIIMNYFKKIPHNMIIASLLGPCPIGYQGNIL